MGRPRVASFVLFTIGAAVPIPPFLSLDGRAAAAASAALSALALFVIGAATRCSPARRRGAPGVASSWGWRRPGSPSASAG